MDPEPQQPRYVTVDAVRATLAGDGAAATRTAADLADEQLLQAILAAEAEVDARLSGRYTVPFADSIPDLVRDITVGIACYVADLQWRGTVDYETEQDPVLLRHARAQRLLAGLVDGSVTLPDGGGQPDLSGGGALAPINPYAGRLFGPSDWQRGEAPSGWHIR